MKMAEAYAIIQGEKPEPFLGCPTKLLRSMQTM